jgi:hypothetical protein
MTRAEGALLLTSVEFVELITEPVFAFFLHAFIGTLPRLCAWPPDRSLDHFVRSDQDPGGIVRPSALAVFMLMTSS